MAKQNKQKKKVNKNYTNKIAEEIYFCLTDCELNELEAINYIDSMLKEVVKDTINDWL